LLTRSKLKKSNQKQADGSVTTLVSDESEILQLDAKVVCASNPEHPIRSCIGCVRREVNHPPFSLTIFGSISFTFALNREKDLNEPRKENQNPSLTNSKILRQKETVFCYSIATH
jgi:hypothetical protein